MAYNKAIKFALLEARAAYGVISPKENYDSFVHTNIRKAERFVIDVVSKLSQLILRIPVSK